MISTRLSVIAIIVTLILSSSTSHAQSFVDDFTGTDDAWTLFGTQPGTWSLADGHCRR